MKKKIEENRDEIEIRRSSEVLHNCKATLHNQKLDFQSKNKIK